MKYIVSLSGGIASAVAADRAIKRYGKENVTLWFADTLWEDEDLYRFLLDLESMWGMKIIRQSEGNNPLEVAEDKQIIPNSHIAPCSYELKIKPFVDYLDTIEKPVTVLLGMDYTEMHRMKAPKKNYEALEGVTVDYPLMWKPLEFRNYFDIVKHEWRLEIPRLYVMGFKHNNCGGRCVKQGIKEWKRLSVHFPDRFDEVSKWEQEQRAKGGPREKFSIAKDQSGGESSSLTLEEIRERYIDIDKDSGQEDLFSCFCSY